MALMFPLAPWIHYLHWSGCAARSLSIPLNPSPAVSAVRDQHLGSRRVSTVDSDAAAQHVRRHRLRLPVSRAGRRPTAARGRPESLTALTN